ncbi:MAG: AAA family ATPase [Elusimicrobia bacterium]|nr:AAA family ATPase [Elusimicrobiota bacterium]
MGTASRLPLLGVYGFDRVETVILAALVTEDPMLLIGPSGTGKTFLLNSLSEALGLSHRHYNASLISFDDLVGFPFPDAERSTVRFLETPATVWGAESVLIDEISRCKPEHQNRLFSLIHERRLQGLPLPKLRFRWAAMNPCGADQGGDDYIGSEPLDPALADRFALFVDALDWDALTSEEKLRVSDPSGEGALSDDGGRLRTEVEAWRAEFLRQLARCPAEFVSYSTAAVSVLNGARVRVSPRRSRLLSRSLLAASIVAGGRSEAVFEHVLRCSLPHAAWGGEISAEAVAAAHRSAWDSCMLTGDRRWVHLFHLEKALPAKLKLLLGSCPGPDAGTQAVEQLLASEPKPRSAAFALAVYPAAVKGGLPIGAEGVNDLGKLASPILTVDGKVTWQERLSDKDTKHPEFARYAKVLSPLSGGRRERAKQFFNWCLASGTIPDDPAGLEGEMNACVELLRPARAE